MSGSGFNKREDSFEKKFAHDGEMFRRGRRRTDVRLRNTPKVRKPD